MMNKAPTIYTLEQFQKVAIGIIINSDVIISPNDQMEAIIDGKKQWIAARPLGFFSIGNRLKAAWLAFTGKVDVVIWPGDQ